MLQKSQTEGFSQLAALGFSLDVKYIYVNPTPIFNAAAKLVFVKDFSMLWVWYLRPFRLQACLEQALAMQDTKRTKHE